jgi:hypothetical protein
MNATLNEKPSLRDGECKTIAVGILSSDISSLELKVKERRQQTVEE